MPRSAMCDDGAAAVDASRLAMSRMMAVAGHDLKQPLHVAMLCMARAIKEGVTPDAANRLRVALDAMQRLDSELTDIALLSQMDALQPNYRVVQMAEVLARVDRDWRMHAELCGIDLDICDCDLLVKTDPDMLHTILRNFVGNALKYSRPGGHVRVACRVWGRKLHVVVEDDGRGIAPSMLESIFDAFERADEDGRSDGLGLGLLIVRQTADLLQHRIAVRSVKNEGSSFSVELPLHASETVSPQGSYAS